MRPPNNCWVFHTSPTSLIISRPSGDTVRIILGRNGLGGDSLNIYGPTSDQTISLGTTNPDTGMSKELIKQGLPLSDCYQAFLSVGTWLKITGDSKKGLSVLARNRYDVPSMLYGPR